MSATIKMHFRLPYRLEREGSVYVSICDELDVRSQGRSEAEAGEMLVEALQLFLETCIQEGTVDAVLRDCGFRPMLDGEVQSDDGTDYLDVPVSLLLAQGGDLRQVS